MARDMKASNPEIRWIAITIADQRFRLIGVAKLSLFVACYSSFSMSHTNFRRILRLKTTYNAGALLHDCILGHERLNVSLLLLGGRLDTGDTSLTIFASWLLEVFRQGPRPSKTKRMTTSGYSGANHHIRHPFALYIDLMPVGRPPLLVWQCWR